MITPEWKAHADAQWQQAKGEQPSITCSCGLDAPLRFMYRCLYCRAYLCFDCAEVHFGKTKQQYWAENDTTTTG